MPCFSHLMEAKNGNCKSVLVGIHVFAYGICCKCLCMLSEHVESIVFGFGFVFLDCCCGLNVVLGVKASLTLGREENPWGEGVSWTLH